MLLHLSGTFLASSLPFLLRKQGKKMTDKKKNEIELVFCESNLFPWTTIRIMNDLSYTLSDDEYSGFVTQEDLDEYFKALKVVDSFHSKLWRQIG